MLDAAQSLLDNSTGEVDWRNAASRAYYAAYHRGHAIAGQGGLQIGANTSTHLALIGALKDSGQASHRSIAFRLSNCRVVRNNADYNIDLAFAKRLAGSTLRQCRGIFHEEN